MTLVIGMQCGRVNGTPYGDSDFVLGESMDSCMNHLLETHMFSLFRTK
jgi:hypothetical protein